MEDIDALQKEFWNGDRNIKSRCDYWLATKFMRCLGYDRFEEFRASVVANAISICVVDAQIPEEHFRSVVNDNLLVDIELSRYGCLLCTICADSRKHPVQKMQSRFAEILKQKLTF